MKSVCDKIGVEFIEEKSYIKEIVFDIRKEKILVLYVPTCVEEF